MPHKKHTRTDKRPQGEVQRRVKVLSVWIELAVKLVLLVNALAELIHKLG